VTNKKTTKNHTFSYTAGARRTVPTMILGMVIEEVRAIFAPNNFFGSDQQFPR